MKRFCIIFSTVVVLLSMVTGCTPRPDTGELVKDMLVQTSFDNTVNFSSYATYAMPMDSIGLLYNNDPKDTLIVNDYAQLVTRELKMNLDRAGYKQVGRKQNPDWGVNVFVVRDFSIFQSVMYPNYYNPYYGYYYPGYYGYYGYYGYPYVNTYAINTATLVIEIIDLKNKNNKGEVKAIWTAYIGDVVTSVDPYQKSREAVDQAFLQSVYIKK